MAIPHSTMLERVAAKVMERPRLAEWVAERRAAGETIVFTNGCFDLLHTGHVRYLREAAGLGDRLVVAANDDAQLASLKGAGRPILPRDERANILAALEFVDAVTIFPEETPHALLEALRPDILVKGGDYGVEGVIGRETVWEYGGEVRTLSLAPGISTSEIVRRCKELP